MTTLHRLSYCLLTSLLFAASALAQAINPTAVDAMVQEAMKAWNVPGASVAIIRGNEVLYIKGYGVKDLREWLGDQIPDGPWFYPEDQIADLPMRMIASEMTREKLTLRLHEELPYQLTVETEKWEDKPDGSTRIDQIIYVSRDGHKGIVLGNKGETIKSIGQAARADISEFLGRTVHLFLQVKVRENWQDEPERYSEMGLDFKDGEA